jgi:hypothetical protein
MTTDSSLMTSRRLLGRVLQVVGVAVVFAGLLMFLWAYAEDRGGFLFLGVAIVFIAGPTLWRTGGRLAVIPGEVLLRTDRRPPVLYLRSFDEEERAHRFMRVIRDAFTVTPILGNYSQWAPMEQWKFAKLMRRIGPYVTVARPGEHLPELGASPIYLEEDEWQSRVLELMKKARFVVVRAGATPGLRWEIEMLWKHVPPQRVLLIAPGRRKVYRAFREWINPLLRKPLPEKLGDVRLIGFNDDGSPAPIDGRDTSRIREAFTPRT